MEENKFGYNRHRYAEYIKPELIKPKKKPVDVTPWIVAIVFLTTVIVMGFFTYNYLQELKLEESPLKVGQIWEEEIIRIPEFRTEIETVYVKNTVIDVTATRVKYIHGGTDTLESDHMSFMCTSRKLR